MNSTLRKDAQRIIAESIQANQPDQAVERALQKFKPGNGKTVLVSVGKAAWQMANAAVKVLGIVDAGIVISKYGHIKGPIADFQMFEAGHPVPDENSFRGTQAAIDMVTPLTEEDTVLFLLSGGGSALFEKPLLSGDELQSITRQLLACGADIVEMNTIRKRLSAVKGGRFAQICAPAKIYAIVLSDILGDQLDMIASGPVSADQSTCRQALEIVQKYDLHFPADVMSLLEQETPKELDNVEAEITGSVRQLCAAAAQTCAELGYRPMILTDMLDCQAKEAGAFLAAIARSHASDGEPLAFLAGGETVVQLTGSGKGGRNQELALSAAAGIEGLPNVLVFSVGSDGTDGPTDAAGGIVDGSTAATLRQQGISIYHVLKNNDAYHALSKVGGLVITGPTGTNVNDVSVVLIR